MILGENYHDMMTFFQTSTNEGSKLATRWVRGLSSSTRAQERQQPWLHTRRVQRGQLREAVGQTRHPHHDRVSFHVDIWLLHIVSNHLQQARTNLTMINYVWYQTFTIKFFISTLNVSFLSLPSPQWTWRIKSIRKRKCGFEVQML